MKTGNGVKGYSFKDIDIQDREVKGYFSAFDNVDSDGDVIVKGAFTKSIQEHGVGSNSNRKVAHLLYHDVTRPIGTLTELKEDDYGLYFVSTLGTHTDGEDALRMYKEGIIREHSIGFQYIPDKIDKSDDGIWTIKEVKLWEGSAVTFGANELTPNLTNAKSQGDLDKVKEDIDERFEVFIKALRDGSYSDKFNNMFEYELRQLKKLTESLYTFEPSTNTHIEKSEEANINYSKFLSQIKF